VRILVKVGGAQLEEAPARAALARSVARAVRAGHELVLVHGGGNQIRDLSRRLGIADRYHEGLRITDDATADVVLMVLAGLVNKTLVAALAENGVRAVGVSGADASSFAARRVTRAGVDLGWVGEIERCDPQLFETLLDAGYLPVVATSAPGASRGEAHFYNVNADLAAGPLARAIEADALLFLTDVAGVLGAEQELMPALSPARVAELREQGVIHGGMIPKVEAALAALVAAPGTLVKIASSAGEDAILSALRPESGTRFANQDG
jgi:acetylglutamate kinase